MNKREREMPARKTGYTLFLFFSSSGGIDPREYTTESGPKKLLMTCMADVNCWKNRPQHVHENGWDSKWMWANAR